MRTKEWVSILFFSRRVFWTKYLVSCKTFCHVDLTDVYLQLNVKEFNNNLAINTLNSLYVNYCLFLTCQRLYFCIYLFVISVLSGIDDIINWIDQDLCQVVLNEVLSCLNDYTVFKVFMLFFVQGNILQNIKMKLLCLLLNLKISSTWSRVEQRKFLWGQHQVLIDG